MEIKDAISLVLSAAALLIPLIIFIVSSPEAITSSLIIVFSSIGIFLLVFSFLVYFISRFNEINADLRKNNQDIEGIKKSLKYKDLFKDMDVRLRVLETLNKKGEIDPRIIYWILILILLYLFLKIAGVLP